MYYGNTRATRLLDEREDEVRYRGHHLTATGPASHDCRPVICRTCGADGAAHLEAYYREWNDETVQRAAFTDNLTGRCDGSEATSASEYVAATGGPTSFRGAERVLALKHGGNERKKLANNTYLIRRSEDRIAVQVHETDVVIYRSDGTLEVRTGGWYSKLTCQRITSYTPDGLQVFTDDPLRTTDGPPRWFITRPSSELSSPWTARMRPHHYARFDRPLLVFPSGGVRPLADAPTTPTYTLERGGNSLGGRRGVYHRTGSRRAVGFATY